MGDQSKDRPARSDRQMEAAKSEKSQREPSMAETGKSRQSEPISGMPKETAAGTTKLYQPIVQEKPSVREELKRMETARKKAMEPLVRQLDTDRSISSGVQPLVHIQPETKNKSEKPKVR